MNAISPGVIEAAARGSVQDRRALYQAISGQLAALAQGTGISLLEPVSGSSTQRPNTQPPAAAALSVTGANGAYSLSITNPAQTLPAAIYHEVSFSDSSSFTGAVTTLPASTATSLTYNAPGATVYWRIRSSYDRANWNGYQVMTAPVAAAKQSSAATENNVVLNQSNFAYVDSVAAGSSANARIYGAGGPGTSLISLKGTAESRLPSATIINVAYSSAAVTAYDGEKYQVKANLPGVFPDTWTPVGKLSVVGPGSVVLPTLALVLDSGGHVLGWNVVTQGNALTGPVTLAINTATGSGATPGAQTITGGKLISVAPGNPGQAYASADTVSVSGGVFGGATGGGTANGGNGGRLTAI